jgi:hypothetical protein
MERKKRSCGSNWRVVGVEFKSLAIVDRLKMTASLGLIEKNEV